jgi:hypothetical protein
MPYANIDLEQEWGLPYPEGSEYEGDLETPAEDTDAYTSGLGGTELPNGKGTVTTPDGQTFTGKVIS